MTARSADLAQTQRRLVKKSTPYAFKSKRSSSRRPTVSPAAARPAALLPAHPAQPHQHRSMPNAAVGVSPSAATCGSCACSSAKGRTSRSGRQRAGHCCTTPPLPTSCPCCSTCTRSAGVPGRPRREPHASPRLGGDARARSHRAVPRLEGAGRARHLTTPRRNLCAVYWASKAGHYHTTLLLATLGVLTFTWSLRRLGKAAVYATVFASKGWGFS